MKNFSATWTDTLPWPVPDDEGSPVEGAGEPDPFQAEADELADAEFIDELSDDMLLDDVGEGNDSRTLYSELPAEDHELQDLLFDWQEDVTSVPVPPLVSTDQAQSIIAGGNSMSASEDAAALNQIALSTGAQGAIMAAQGELGQSKSDTMQHLGQGHSQESAVMGAAQAAEQALDTALQAVEVFYDAVRAAAELLG